MSMTLSIHRELLQSAHHLFSCNQFVAARKRLSALLKMRGFDAVVRLDAHRLQGEVCLELAQYDAARRHLKVVLGHRPDDAELHFLYAEAISRETKSDPKQSQPHYRKALAYAPTQAKYVRGYAENALRLGNERVAVTLLRRTAERQPEDLDTLCMLVDALVDLGRFREAESRVRQAEFVCRGNHRIETIRQAIRYEITRRKQRTECAATDVSESLILAFTSATVVPKPQTVRGSIRRTDRISKSLPHLHRLPLASPDLG